MNACTPRRRSLLQFSLRTLFWLVLLVAAFFGGRESLRPVLNAERARAEKAELAEKQRYAALVSMVDAQLAAAAAVQAEKDARAALLDAAADLYRTAAEQDQAALVENQPVSKEAEADAKRLHGTWVLQPQEGAEEQEARSIRFEGDKVSGLFRDEKKNPLTLGFRLLADRKIKGIDVGPFPAEYQGLVMRGIYELDGDELKLVFQPKLDARQIPPGYDPEERRPKSFDPKLVKLQVWRREK